LGKSPSIGVIVEACIQFTMYDDYKYYNRPLWVIVV